MSALRPLRMRAGLIFSVDTTPVAMRTHAFRVSTLSNKASQASCRRTVGGQVQNTEGRTVRTWQYGKRAGTCPVPDSAILMCACLAEHRQQRRKCCTSLTVAFKGCCSSRAAASTIHSTVRGSSVLTLEVLIVGGQG